MKLYVIGIGPGDLDEMSVRAVKALEQCEVVAGYQLYLGLLRPLLEGKELIGTGMTKEVERCKAAISAALAGKTVAVVSSGDAGVYGMAGLIFQLAQPYPELDIQVISGITAACSAAAVLGAPLTHDFAAISLSDLLTDWQTIENRLRLAAKGDFAIALYNPGSRARKNHLPQACQIVAESRSLSTPCGIVRNTSREGQACRIVELRELMEMEADMLSTVIIGNSQTQVLNGRLVTPRGYHL